LFKKPREMQLTLEQQQAICKKEKLKEWAHLTLRERCAMIEQLFGKKIAVCTLVNYYKRGRVSYTKVKIKFPNRKTEQEMVVVR